MRPHTAGESGRSFLAVPATQLAPISFGERLVIRVSFLFLFHITFYQIH